MSVMNLKSIILTTTIAACLGACERIDVAAVRNAPIITLAKTGYATQEPLHMDRPLLPEELPIGSLVHSECRAYAQKFGFQLTYSFSNCDNEMRKSILSHNPSYRWGRPARNLRVPDLDDDGKFGPLQSVEYASVQKRHAVQKNDDQDPWNPAIYSTFPTNPTQ